MQKQPFWRTAICNIGPRKETYYGYPTSELMGRISFGTMVYLLLRGELPQRKVGKLMDALLIAMCDYGPQSPSVATARYAASGRPSLMAAICSGLLCLGEAHGATLGYAMEVFYDGIQRLRSGNTTVENIAAEIVKEYKSQKKYIPGYGSPTELGADDPNVIIVPRMRELAKRAGVYGEYMRLSDSIEKELKTVIMNGDGAYAALLCEMGFEPRIGEVVFALGRILGLAAEANEEFTREKPFRQIPYNDVVYDGPPERQLPVEYRQDEI